MKITAVIPTYNGAPLLAETLRAVKAAAGRIPGAEVVVVVDGSTDNTRELLESSFPEVIALTNPENLGFIPSANRGVREAAGELVALFHHDVRPQDDALVNALKYFDDPATFAVSFRTADDADGAPRPALHPASAHSIFRKSMFMELGGFDPLFSPFFFEDADVGYRAWKKGWRTVYEPACQVVHAGPGTLQPLYGSTSFRRIRQRNGLFFKWKNLDGLYFVGHFLLLALRAAFAWSWGDLEFYRVLKLSSRKKLPVLLSRNARIRRGEVLSDTKIYRRLKKDSV